MALGVAKRSLVVKDADASAVSRTKAKTSKKKEASSLSKPKTTAVKKSGTKKKAVASKKAAKPNTKKAATSKVKKVTKAKVTTKSKVQSKAKTKSAASSSAKKTKSSTKAGAKKTKTKSSAKTAATSLSTATIKAAHKDVQVVLPALPDSKKIPLTRRDPLGHLLLEQSLRQAGFAGVVSTDRALLDTYSTDESIFSVQPQVVLLPRDRRDVTIAAKVVANETRRFASLSLTPRAAGTGLSGGSLSNSVIIDVSQSLTQIETPTYHKNEAQITVEPGVKWRDMEKQLQRIGYYVPCYSQSRDRSCVGGEVANNSAGPESVTHGHCADWITSLSVVLHDGKEYEISPLTYKQLQALQKKDTAHARIAASVFTLLEKHEAEIKKNQPNAAHNTAGYNLRAVLPDGVRAFKKGKGTFNLIPLLAGSQGTVGIITSITFRAIPLPGQATTLCVPIYDLSDLPAVLKAAKQYNPRSIEAFDDLTFDIGLQNPEYFRTHVHGLSYYRTVLSMYSSYHIRLSRKLPTLFVLINLDESALKKHSALEVAEEISTNRTRARVIQNPTEETMWWLLQHSSYDLSKRLDATKRPAAFLEDMSVPDQNLPKFITEIRRLCKEFDIKTTMHGNIGAGNLQFYPLLDFTNKTTASLVEKMSERFFALAVKFGGTFSGQHNDGIIRTPYLDKLYSKKMLAIFAEIEEICDPNDIFNPGKKVNPRFEVREVIRTQN